MQRQIRLQLSTCLLAVLSQQLVERKNGRGRVAACELMMVTPAHPQPHPRGQDAADSRLAGHVGLGGSVTMDNALIALARNRDITSQTAIDAAHDVDYVRKSVR